MSSPIKGNVTLNGKIKVQWYLHRTAHIEHDDPTEDVDVRSHDRITISADNAPIGDMIHAVNCAESLRNARSVVMMCPASDAWLEAVGLDARGSVILQIWRGEDKKSAAPAHDLAHLDPAQYSSNPEAMASVAWMRDVATAVRDSKSVAELRDAIFAASQCGAAH